MKIKERAIQIIESFRGRLLGNFVDDFISCAQHGEEEIAIENLCTQLYEFDVPITASELKMIIDISSDLELAEDNWVDLKELVTPSTDS